MTLARKTRSMRLSLAATAAALLSFSQSGCGGSNASVHVLRESEEIIHLPAGTRIEPPGGEAFTIGRSGAWLVDAGYLSRIHRLLGLGEAGEGSR